MSVQIHDISMPLTPDVAVFPGDTPPRREMLLDMQQGDHLTLSTLHSTVHLGTHIDGPCHYVKDGAGVESMPLWLGYGPALVIDAPGEGPVPASVLPEGDLPQDCWYNPVPSRPQPLQPEVSPN